MSTTRFRTRIRESIDNEILQLALDNNSERRLKGRALAFESIPDWRTRRSRAHRIRAQVIDHLDEFLNRFIAKNEENGVSVHRAKDAVEAIQITLTIARQASARLFAKSKSMVSEEIALNHALEREGMQVIETDLGEYIVQLRHERPSHIITPAAHLRRQQVAQLFHEVLGIPYTEDIPSLTATARRVLREVFLTADVGLGGVNFGVAETGGICVVSNEGNARMVATVPRLHIALMGMERLVPGLDDLALMLSLLARSATGQKLSVYTQILNRPLAGQTRHLILLDNSRLRLRNSPLKESLYCIRCGACLNACPVFRELSGHAYIGGDGSIAPYPGPIGSVVSPGLFGENYVHLAQASSLCGACRDACPVDIDLPKLLTRVRAGESPSPTGRGVRGQGGAGLSFSTKLFLKIFTRLATHPRLFAASQKFAALGTSLLAPASAWVRLPAFTGWGYSKDLPRFSGRTFRERWNRRKVTRRSAIAKEALSTREDSSVNSFAQDEMDQAAQFTNELETLGGKIRLTQDPTAGIIELLKALGIDKIHLEPNLLDEIRLRNAGIEFTHEADPQIRAGVTRALCGLADTGSILVAEGEGHPLHASLLPEIHVAVLRKADILPSLSQAMKIPQVVGANAAVFISGPSRTADIEMTLTIGVHGPREIHVFVDDSISG
jgi:L-lactate dehydrogenase complex protein LldF